MRLMPKTEALKQKLWRPSQRQWDALPSRVKKLKRNIKKNPALRKCDHNRRTAKGEKPNGGIGGAVFVQRPPKHTGFSFKNHVKIMAVAREEATIVVDRLIEMGKVSIEDKDGYAKDAFVESVAILKGTAVAKDKLVAARLILEYTTEKPVAKSEVSVQKAEDFLKALIED